MDYKAKRDYLVHSQWPPEWAGDLCWINLYSKDKSLFSQLSTVAVKLWWVLALRVPLTQCSNVFLIWSLSAAQTSPQNYSALRVLVRPVVWPCQCGLCWPDSDGRHSWMSSGQPDWPLVFGTMKKWLSVLQELPHSLLPDMPVCHDRSRLCRRCFSSSSTPPCP